MSLTVPPGTSAEFMFVIVALRSVDSFSGSDVVQMLCFSRHVLAACSYRMIIFLDLMLFFSRTFYCIYTDTFIMNYELLKTHLLFEVGDVFIQ